MTNQPPWEWIETRGRIRIWRVVAREARSRGSVIRGARYWYTLTPTADPPIGLQRNIYRTRKAAQDAADAAFSFTPA